MAIKNSVQSTTDKILNSDIYDITAFVDDIKKVNIDGINNPQETLQVGMYGYLGYEFASVLQNAIVVSSELANEAIPTRAKFDRNVITHALSLGIKKIQATAASMRVMLIFPEKAFKNNMVNDRFILKASTPIMFDNLEFHTDYDIVINRVQLDNSSIGSRSINYVYTGVYDMRIPNTESDIENAYLPPIGVYADGDDNMIVVTTTLHQVEYTEIEHKIVGNDNLANKTFNFTFENQLSHFTVTVYENNDRDNPINLVPYYDGLYHNPYTDRPYNPAREKLNESIIDAHVYTGTTSTTAVEEEKYCYYQYINSNTIRIRFDPESYQPRTNANIVITVWTSHGSEGNIYRTEDLTVRLTSDNYTNLYMIVKQRGDEGAYGGIDRKSVPELQKIIPKEALSRGSITTLTDLRNYFNSINNEDSVLHVFRKEDNILNRLYYTYSLMKDADNNVVPTNTIPVYTSQKEESESEDSVGDMYIESGEPLYLYKKPSTLPFIYKNYIAYSDVQDSIASETANVTGPYNTDHPDYLIRWADIMQYLNNPGVYHSNFNEFIKEYLIPGDPNPALNQPLPNIYLFTPGQTIEFELTVPIDAVEPNFVSGKKYRGTVVRVGYLGDNANDPYPDIYYPSDYQDITKWDRYDRYAMLKLRVNAVNDNGEYEVIEMMLPYYNVVQQVSKLYLATSSIKCSVEYIYGSETRPLSDFKFESGKHIRFCRYKPGEDIDYTLKRKENWYTAEVLSKIDKYSDYNVSSTNSVTLLFSDPYKTYGDISSNEDLEFERDTFNIPTGGILNDHSIIGLEDITNFVYTCPMSIVLRDNKEANGHRVDASYFLDMINETRYMDFSCINSLSPLQYIGSYVKVSRPSWISFDRYRYTIDIDITPNTGSISEEMIARTQVIGVYYDDNNLTIPIGYSIGEMIENDGNVLKYRFYLYTRPFKPRKQGEFMTVDKHNKLYIGQKQSPYNELYAELIEKLQYIIDHSTDPEEIARAQKELDEVNHSVDILNTFLYLKGTNTPVSEDPQDATRMDLNTHFRVYTLYKYPNDDTTTGRVANDDITKNYFDTATNVSEYAGTPLKSIVPPETEFPGDPDAGIPSYTLNDMILTNVYDTHDGINLLYNYSNLMNSYVHMISENPDSDVDKEISYIVNRVPAVRYFYLNSEEKINNFIREMKRKIIYVLDAIDPLETNFGIDYKLFNTYGPSKMYYITKGGNRSEQPIDNVCITMTFRTKFYNEENDATTIIPQIKDTIKELIENIEELNDLHFPNITTEIETKFSQYIIYFEYVSFNIYDANMQHIVTDEDMETLSIVPEFLNVNVDDSTGLPFINIEIVS